MASNRWCLEATSCKSLQTSSALKCQAQMPDLGCRIPTTPPSLIATNRSRRWNLRAQCIDWYSLKHRKNHRAPSQKLPLTPRWDRRLQPQHQGAVWCQEGGQWASTGARRRSGRCRSRVSATSEIAPGVEQELGAESSPSISVGVPESPRHEGVSPLTGEAHNREPVPAYEARNPSHIVTPPKSTPPHDLEVSQIHELKQGILEESPGGKVGDGEARDSSEPGTSFEVRAAASEEELLAVAWLRADVYADGLPYTRFVDSYRKQFAEQEFGSLLKRTKAQTGRHLRCCCLVAVDPTALASLSPASDYVIGTLDVSLKQLMPGERIAGEETSEESVTFAGKRPVTKARKFVYISNVCVPERARRRGVAARMMGAAALVVKDWGFSEVFCHVDVDNKGAQQLYRKLGYEKYGEVVVQETVSGAHVSLRRTLLLRAELEPL